MKISKDTNGNKIIKIERSDIDPYDQFNRYGFSIQTLGNLPKTHRYGVHYETKTEVFEFIRLYGTKRQKELVGVRKEITLKDIRDGFVGYNVCFKEYLNDSDLDQLVSLIGGRGASKCRVRSVLNYDLPRCDLWGVGDRFTLNLESGKWSYCAGQDYPHEMNQVRKALIK